MGFTVMLVAGMWSVPAVEYEKFRKVLSSIPQE
jgi:hypothetical protein